MTVVRTLVFALGLALGGAALAQPPAAPRDPVVRSGATTKLSAHVWAIPDDGVPAVPNVGFVVGDKAVLVIETGMGPPNGRTVLAEAQKLAGPRKLYLVTTHVHPEHDLGAQAFPASTTLIRSNDQVREIGEQGLRMADVFRSRSAVNARLLEGAAFRKADMTFDKSQDLDLGGVKVRILAMGPDHTQGDTAIFVEGERVLFAGDLAMKGWPAFASSKSSLNHWLSSLDVLDGLKPRIVVPSHGPIGDAAFIAGYRSYLTRIRDRTAAAKRSGKTLDEATATVTAELKPDYPDTSRMAGAIRSAYAEAR
jgi:glyoxylase-like metal-dependent hydrolase (beta-lactamase superfamily II)